MAGKLIIPLHNSKRSKNCTTYDPKQRQHPVHKHTSSTLPECAEPWTHIDSSKVHCDPMHLV